MRSKTSARLKPASKGGPVRRPAKRAKSPLGALPEWNLADLYSGLDDPAIKRDLDRTDAACTDFENAYKGKLADMAASPTAGASASCSRRSRW